MPHGLVRIGTGRILPPPRRPGMLEGLSSQGGGSPGGPILVPPKPGWSILDDFEDDDVAEYSGNPGMFDTGDDNVRRGSFALQGLFPSDNVMYRTDIECKAGNDFRVEMLKDLAGGLCEQMAFGFGCVDTTSGYWACCDYANSLIQLWESVPGGGSLHAQTAFTFVDLNWYKLEIKWAASGYVEFSIGATRVSFTDTTYTTGGFGWYSAKSGPGTAVCWADHAEIKT